MGKEKFGALINNLKWELYNLKNQNAEIVQDFSFTEKSPRERSLRLESKFLLKII